MTIRFEDGTYNYSNILYFVNIFNFILVKISWKYKTAIIIMNCLYYNNIIIELKLKYREYTTPQN